MSLVVLKRGPHGRFVPAPGALALIYWRGFGYGAAFMVCAAAAHPRAVSLSRQMASGVHQTLPA